MMLSLLVALTAVLFFPGGTLSFGVVPSKTTPPAFVKEVVVPWCNRARTLFPEKYSNACYPLCDLSPEFERAALRYEKELGIPRIFFYEWVSSMFKVDEDGDMYFNVYDTIENWGSNQSVCIEGGDFDWIEMYCRLVEQRIQERKEAILTAIESSETVNPLPLELTAIPREVLISSHEHNEALQNSLTVLIKERGISALPWKALSPIANGEIWFVSMNNIRYEHYFPPQTWKDHPISKELRVIFDFGGLFGSTETYGAVQRHLIRHLEEWRTNLDSLPKLFNEIAEPLMWRDHDDKFLTPGAMEMSPKELLHHERESILDMPFAGLENLDDTARVKVLRTERQVQDTETALNTTLLHCSWLAISASGACKQVAVALCDKEGRQVAVGEFHFNGVIRGRHTAKVGGGSTVTIHMQNDKSEPIDKNLISLCKDFHRDFLYGWRVEKLEEDDPKWLRWQEGLAVSLKIIKLLIKSGADPSIRVTIKRIEYSSSDSESSCSDSDSDDDTRVLLDDSDRDNDERPRRAGLRRVQALLEKLRDTKVNVDDDRYGCSPLHWAYLHYHFEIAKMLIENGADVRATDDYGMTPLHWASYLGYLDIVQVLLKRGANANAESKQGWTSFHLACEENHLNVVWFLVRQHPLLVVAPTATLPAKNSSL